MKTDNQLQYTQENRLAIDEKKPTVIFNEFTEMVVADCDSSESAQRIVKAVNEYDSLKRKEVMHDELVESVKMLYQLAQQMSEAATKIKFKHDGIEQLLKQAEQK